MVPPTKLLSTSVLLLQFRQNEVFDTTEVFIVGGCVVIPIKSVFCYDFLKLKYVANLKSVMVTFEMVTFALYTRKIVRNYISYL